MKLDFWHHVLHNWPLAAAAAVICIILIVALSTGVLFSNQGSISRAKEPERFSRWIRWMTTLLLLCLAVLFGSYAMAFQVVRPKATVEISVGSMRLHPCETGAAWCGDVMRALDPQGAIADSISIHFEFYRHTAPGNSEGTLVATEGGPGYPATLSRDAYLQLFAPLLATHDFVLMDNRGTGQSGALDCPDLQSATSWTLELIGACGASLGERAALYSTAYAADDLAAILDALKAGPVDLYGDSYGTFFEQVFAVRHPQQLRSMVLDGAFPLEAADYGWYPTYGPAVRDKYNLACARSASCAARAGSGMDHIQPLLDALRAQPFAAHAPDADGEDIAFTADASRLAIVMYSGSPALTTVRDMDAAARAFTAGDRAPLLRLMAETTTAVDSRDPKHEPAKWSAALAAAVTCQDLLQVFDMSLAPAARKAARDQAIAERQRLHPDTYAPFTIDEYRGMPLDYSFIDQCVTWPVSPAAHPASHVVAANAGYPDIPALVISGELDDITTVADGAAVAAEFKRGRQVRIANSFHVNALPHARSACGAELVQRFIRNLDPGDISCAAAVPPVRLVEQFALKAAALNPVLALPGNQANEEQLKWVNAAVMTLADTLVRASVNSSGHGTGLRGGHFEIHDSATGRRLALRQMRWTEDVAVDGELRRSAPRDGTVHASVSMAAPDRTQGTLDVRWNEGAAYPQATIRGNLGGRAVSATAPAP
jgi:pimeloyl-ACP methyl ester carboxylesterase